MRNHKAIEIAFEEIRDGYGISYRDICANRKKYYKQRILAVVSVSYSLSIGVYDANKLIFPSMPTLASIFTLHSEYLLEPNYSKIYETILHKIKEERIKSLHAIPEEEDKEFLGVCPIVVEEPNVQRPS